MTDQTEKVRLTPERRKFMIVKTAVELSNEVGLFSWTRKDVAERCAVTTSDETIKHYFRTQDILRKLVAEHEDANAKVLADARAVGLVPEA